MARKRTTITLGKGPKNLHAQKLAYERAMQVQRGELVWCLHEHATRFGARGDYVTPERCEELTALANETLDERLVRLAQYIDSTRYSLTEADVRRDYILGIHRYAVGQSQWLGSRKLVTA